MPLILMPIDVEDAFHEHMHELILHHKTLQSVDSWTGFHHLQMQQSRGVNFHPWILVRLELDGHEHTDYESYHTCRRCVVCPRKWSACLARFKKRLDDIVTNSKQLVLVFQIISWHGQCRGVVPFIPQKINKEQITSFVDSIKKKFGLRTVLICVCSQMIFGISSTRSPLLHRLYKYIEATPERMRTMGKPEYPFSYRDIQEAIQKETVVALRLVQDEGTLPSFGEIYRKMAQSALSWTFAVQSKEDWDGCFDVMEKLLMWFKDSLNQASSYDHWRLDPEVPFKLDVTINIIQESTETPFSSLMIHNRGKYKCSITGPVVAVMWFRARAEYWLSQHHELKATIPHPWVVSFPESKLTKVSQLSLGVRKPRWDYRFSSSNTTAEPHILPLSKWRDEDHIVASSWLRCGREMAALEKKFEGSTRPAFMLSASEMNGPDFRVKTVLNRFEGSTAGSLTAIPQIPIYMVCSRSFFVGERAPTPIMHVMRIIEMCIVQDNW